MNFLNSSTLHIPCGFGIHFLTMNFLNSIDSPYEYGFYSVKLMMVYDSDSLEIALGQPTS